MRKSIACGPCSGISLNNGSPDVRALRATGAFARREKTFMQETEMDLKIVEKIKSSAAYRELVRKRSKLGWTLTALVLIVYYGYVLLIAFNKDLLSAKMGAGVMTWGMPIGLFVIVFTVVITGLYVRHANRTYDELTDKIKREAA
jgi:uncharacterized membrane protein (DUF485 family)